MAGVQSLSAENPIATAAQRAVEDRALALLERPELRRAREIAAMLWRNAVAYPVGPQMARFDNMIDEYVFWHVLHAAGGDPGDPAFIRISAPPHRWFGRDIPGSRWGGDSPDFLYRFVPIAHGGRYEIHGRQRSADRLLVAYALMGDNTAAPATQGLLDSLEMTYGENGGFVITLDSEPANGRPNHVQTRPGAEHLLIRDILADWQADTPNQLEIHRLDRPDGARLSDETLAQRAAKTLLDGVYYTYYCTRSGSGQPPNQVRDPLSSGAFGGMATQWGAKGNLHLADDEAFVVTTTAAGAGFRNVMLSDAFHMSLNYATQTGSFNMRQMAADADGRFTYVVAHEDPGVHNWLNTDGLTQTIFGHRWQAFPPGAPHETPTITTRLVKFSDLEEALPAGVVRLDAAGRRAQIAGREAGFARRFVDK